MDGCPQVTLAFAFLASAAVDPEKAQLLEQVLPFLRECFCHSVGNSDFVATMIALLLAAEFWEPLSKYLWRYLQDAELKPEAMMKSLQLSKLDDDAKAALMSKLESYSRGLIDQSVKNKELIEISRRYSSISFSLIGFLLLYFGTVSAWNGLLALPIIVFVLWGTILYHSLVSQVNKISKKVRDELCDHVFEAGELGIDLPSDGPTSKGSD